MAKQKKRGPPAQKRALNLRFDLKALNPLRPIWRWAQSKLVRQPSWHAFAGWQTYYSAYLRTDASAALIHHSGPYVGSLSHQSELLTAMLAGRRAAIACASPGCGKSRFALELARRIEREHPRWQAVFVRQDERGVRAELPQLMQSKRVVFIVDDAHECPEIVELLAAACAEAAETASLHLVCLTRSVRHAEVSRIVNRTLPPGMILEIDLGRPSPELVRSLIDQLLPQSSPHHRDTIARFARQSYFGAVLACSALSRDARLPQTFQRHDLRDRIRRELLRDPSDGVCPIETALRALAVYAALAPVPRGGEDASEWAARLSGLTPVTVNVLIDRVLGAGLFQEDGQALIRPIPDLLGDLILEEACLDEQGKPTPFSAQLLATVLEADPLATVRNCADIGLLFGTPGEVDLLSELFLERARTAAVGNQRDILELLRTAQPLAACRPMTVVELARILDARGILRRKPPAAELSGTDSVEMDTYALLMSAGEVDPTAVPLALALGHDLYAAARGDARSRERVRDRLKACCRFEKGRSLAHAQAVIDALQSWASEPDVEQAALAASLSARYLTLDGEGRNPSSVSEVWHLRDLAIDTLARGMAHGNAAVQCVAIGSLERYADQEETPDQTWSDQWAPQLAREAQRLSAPLIKLAQESTHLPVAAAAELRGWDWWARHQEVLHGAGAAILRAIPDTDAYRLWKLLYALRLPVRTALPEPVPPRPQDRLQYLQTFSTSREDDTKEQARHLFDTLGVRHPDMHAWRALWLVVLQQSPRMPIGHHAGIVVAEFTRRHPDVAWSFVNQADAEGPLFALLPLLLMELGRLDRARRSQEARNVPAGTRLEEAWFRALSFTSDLDEPERAILARGLESTDSDTVHRTADALLAAGGADRSRAFRKVFGVIAHHPTDSGLWELAIERFVNWAEAVLPPGSNEPAEGMAQVANELMTLWQTQGPHLRWGFQRHTRQLPRALAIAAVLCPRRMQEWMQRDWRRPEGPGGSWSDASPLTVARLPEIMRLTVDSPAAAQWIEIFSDWMRRDPQLAGIGALGLAELCSLDDSRVRELGKGIGTHPTDASRKAFEEFVNHRKKRERLRAP